MIEDVVYSTKKSPIAENFRIEFNEEYILFEYKNDIENEISKILPVSGILEICSFLIWIVIYINYNFYFNFIVFTIFMLWIIYLLYINKYFKKSEKKLMNGNINHYHRYKFNKDKSVKLNKKEILNTMEEIKINYIKYYTEKRLLMNINYYVGWGTFLLMFLYWIYINIFNEHLY